jgi:hypothetical protein
LESLRAWLIPNYKAGASKKGKGKALALLNLDDPSNGTDRFLGNTTTGPSAHIEDEDADLAAVLQYLTSCAACPHKGSLCARKANGAHVRMTSAYAEKWAKKLVSTSANSFTHK